MEDIYVSGPGSSASFGLHHHFLVINEEKAQFSQSSGKVPATVLTCEKNAMMLERRIFHV